MHLTLIDGLSEFLPCILVFSTSGICSSMVSCLLCSCLQLKVPLLQTHTLLSLFFWYFCTSVPFGRQLCSSFQVLLLSLSSFPPLAFVLDSKWFASWYQEAPHRSASRPPSSSGSGFPSLPLPGWLCNYIADNHQLCWLLPPAHLDCLLPLWILFW